jgi:hypothetical protein
MSQERQNQYFTLIEQLLSCPNGNEPDVLDAHAHLIDADLVKTMMQVATFLAHQDNQDGAKFLVHTARELAKQMGLYPQTEQTNQSQ